MAAILAALGSLKTITDATTCCLNIYQQYNVTTDAPLDVRFLQVRLQFVQARLQGWARYFTQISHLNNEQIETITKAVQTIKEEVLSMKTELTDWVEKTQSQRINKVLWCAANKARFEERLEGLKKIVEDGDNFFQKEFPFYEKTSYAEYEAKHSSESNTEPSEFPDGEDAGDTNVPLSEEFDKTNASETSNLDVSSQSNEAYATDSDYEPDSCPEDVERLVSVEEFLEEFCTVACAVDPWDNSRLDSDKYNNDPNSNSLYKIVSSLMASSSIHVEGGRSWMWSDFSVQHWVRAGGWYLALARTLLAHRESHMLEMKTVLITQFLVNSVWAFMSIRELEEGPSVEDAEDNISLQVINLQQAFCDTREAAENILEPVVLTFAANNIYNKMESFWSLNGIEYAPACMRGEEIAVLAGRILRSSSENSTCELSIPAEIKGQWTALCPNAYLAVPLPHEPSQGSPHLFHCACVSCHRLPFKVTRKFEARKGDQPTSLYIRTEGPERKVIYLQAHFSSSAAQENALVQIEAFTIRLGMKKKYASPVNISLPEIEKVLGLVRSPFDQRPANTLLLRDKKNRLIKPKERIPAVQSSWLSFFSNNDSVTSVSSDEVLAKNIDRGKEPSIGQFQIQVVEYINDSRTMARLVNLPLSFEIEINLSDALRILFIGHLDTQILLRPLIAHETGKFEEEIQMDVRLPNRNALIHFHQAAMMSRIPRHYTTVESKQWEITTSRDDQSKTSFSLLVFPRKKRGFLWGLTYEFPEPFEYNKQMPFLPRNRKFSSLAFDVTFLPRGQEASAKSKNKSKSNSSFDERLEVQFDERDKANSQSLRAFAYETNTLKQCQIHSLELKPTEGKQIYSIQDVIIEWFLSSENAPVLHIYFPANTERGHDSTEYGLYLLKISTNSSLRNKTNSPTLKVHKSELRHAKGYQWKPFQPKKRDTSLSGTILLNFYSTRRRRAAQAHIQSMIDMRKARNR